jgi:hypothetical protein
VAPYQERREVRIDEKALVSSRMQFPQVAFRPAVSTFIVALVAAGIGAAGALSVSHSNTAAPAQAAAVTAAAAVSKAPEDLQVIMQGDESAGSSPSVQQASAPQSAGADGPAGLDGAAGADGAAGLDGAAGADGAVGADGPAGPEGPQGSLGATGPAGSAGATGPAGPVGPSGVGLTAVDHDGGGYEIMSPDGISYRIHVTNRGIIFEGPATTEVWSDTSHFQTLIP